MARNLPGADVKRSTGIPWPVEELLRDQAHSWWSDMSHPDGVSEVITRLQRQGCPSCWQEHGPEFKTWWHVGQAYRAIGRVWDAVTVFDAMYEQYLDMEAGVEPNGRLNKAWATFELSECFAALGCPAHAERYLLLSVCEEAAVRSQESGGLSPQTFCKLGTYRRLRSRGWTQERFERLFSLAAQEAAEEPVLGGHAPARPLSWFPEWILQGVLRSGQATTSIPAPLEAPLYRVNRRYVDQLRAMVGREQPASRGHALEHLAEYLLSSIPGCRTVRRTKTYSSDLDVVCSMAGTDLDFRADFGRYFVVECKSSEGRADVTDVLKFSRVLDSLKCRFGILFAWNGVTQAASKEGEPRYALREELKLFLDRGIVLVVITKDHTRRVAEQGESLLGLLREEYERVRFDVPSLAHRECARKRARRRRRLPQRPAKHASARPGAPGPPGPT